MHWPLVTRRTAERREAEARTETRRRIIDHLRQNPHGLVILDRTELNNVTAPGPLMILGDGVTLTGSMFLTGGRVES